MDRALVTLAENFKVRGRLDEYLGYAISVSMDGNARAAQGEPPSTNGPLDLVQEAIETLRKQTASGELLKGKSARATQAHPPATLRL